MNASLNFGGDTNVSGTLHRTQLRTVIRDENNDDDEVEIQLRRIVEVDADGYEQGPGLSTGQLGNGTFLGSIDDSDPEVSGGYFWVSLRDSSHEHGEEDDDDVILLRNRVSEIKLDGKLPARDRLRQIARDHDIPDGIALIQVIQAEEAADLKDDDENREDLRKDQVLFSVGVTDYPFRSEDSKLKFVFTLKWDGDAKRRTDQVELKEVASPASELDDAKQLDVGNAVVEFSEHFIDRDGDEDDAWYEMRRVNDKLVEVCVYFDHHSGNEEQVHNWIVMVEKGSQPRLSLRELCCRC